MPGMPHATSPQEDEEKEFQNALLQIVGGQPGEQGLDVDTLFQPSEKAEDAVNYESDDSLADEEDANPATSLSPHQAARPSPPDGLVNFMDQDLPELTSANGEHEGDDIDDLFGGGPSSPEDFRFAHDGGSGPAVKNTDHDFNVDDLFGDSSGDILENNVQPEEIDGFGKPAVFKSIEVTTPEPIMSKEEQLQRELFAMSTRNALAGSDYPPAPPENQEELLASLWPRFERNTVPRFMDLLPPKVAHWRGQRPLKPPKPIQPTKVSLELAIDQEKLFRAPNPNYKRVHDEMEPRVIRIAPLTSASDDDDDEIIDIESDYENEPIGGVSWQDLQILCQDWDMHTEDFSVTDTHTDRIETHLTRSANDEDDLFREVDENRRVKVGIMEQS